MKNTVKIAELTSAEAKESLTDKAVLLIPMGSLEDQGTHAPMGDYLTAEAVAIDIAKEATKQGVPTFVSPVIPFGGKDWFESSLGGVSLSHATIAAILDEMLACFTRHGLKRILIVNGHGGNVPPITEVAQNWRTKHGVYVTSMYLWQIGYGLLKEILGEEGAAKSSGHGADPLTSVAMHYFPDLLRTDLIKTPLTGLKLRGAEIGGFGFVNYGGVPFLAPLEAAETAPNGVWGGDPNLCSAETGQKLADKLIALGAGFIKDHVSKEFTD
nr:creatininase family protein [uncultured Cohaesibacter sp.]